MLVRYGAKLYSLSRSSESVQSVFNPFFYLLRRPVPNPVMFFVTAFPWSTPATPIRLIRICVEAHPAVSDPFLHLLLLDQGQAKGLLMGVTASAVPTGTQQVCSLTHLQYSACTLQSRIIVNDILYLQLHNLGLCLLFKWCHEISMPA